MKVLALRADAGGCAYYRVQEPIRVLREQFSGEHEFQIDTELIIDAERDSDTNKLTIHSIETDADVVILQRPLLGDLTVALQRLQKQGVAVVVEVDDDFEAIHHRSVAWAAVQPQYSPEANWRHLARAAALADWVTVSTPSLAKRYGKHGRVSVLRNNVPESIFSVAAKIEPPSTPRIGWTGTLQTHPTDLQVMSNTLADALRSGLAAFHVIGDGKAIKNLLHLDEEPTVTGWVELDRYYQTIVDTIDIGIAPLEISIFNTAKSWLKPLEFAALGVPFIASPTEEYRNLEAGVIAKRPRDWARQFELLATNPDLRKVQAASNLEHVRSLTYENYAETWIQAWSSAVTHRRDVQS